MALFSDSLAAYQKAIQINPKAPLAWNNICAELNNRKKFAEAAYNCRKAIALEPNFVLAKNNLKYSQSQINKQKVDLIKRKESFLNNNKLKPTELIDIGLKFYSANELKTSIEIWSKISKESKLFALAQSNISASYILLKNYSQAEKAINLALSIEPKNKSFINNKKWLESELKK